MMSERIADLFGTRPRGAWLAERVWEPTLSTSLNEAGVEYILVDDNHFIKSGLTREFLGGYYITEDRGRMVRIFPGSEPLRYLIPFKPVEELEEHLKGLEGFLKAGNAAIYGDDGEKFGVWPGTHKWVFTEGWLEEFFQKIESLDWIKPVTLSEYVDAEPPLGRVYLPTTSYMEMGEWSLPAPAAKDYHALNKNMGKSEDGDSVLRFVQGGTWRNFFAKYPESNWMNKRMLLASRNLGKAEEQMGGKAGKGAGPRDKAISEARRLLYKAQCNDAYWHGVFGGLYLPHLREEVYRNLLSCEEIIDMDVKGPATVESIDVAVDGSDEVVIRSQELNLFLSPASGGALYELDYKPAGVNLSNTLTRWPEAYHDKLTEEPADDKGDGTKSIHDMVLTKEEGLHRFLKIDRYRRGSLIDHFLDAGATLEAFKDGEHEELGDFIASPFEARIKKSGVELNRSGVVDGTVAAIKKEIKAAGPGSFTVSYRLDAEGLRERADVRFGVEFNLIMPCCEGPACFYGFDEGVKECVPPEEMGLGSTGELTEIERITLADGLTGVILTIEADRPTTLWRFPVHTVSLSEAGFERIFQGSCLVFLVPLAHGRKGRKDLELTVRAERFLK
jgi:alpha-amylase